MRMHEIKQHFHGGFQVKVVGDPLGVLGTLVVDFKWPFEVANGKWLLYLTEISTEGTSESHCVPPGEIVNPLNLTVSTNAHRQGSTHPFEYNDNI